MFSTFAEIRPFLACTVEKHCRKNLYLNSRYGTRELPPYSFPATRAGWGNPPFPRGIEPENTPQKPHLPEAAQLAEILSKIERCAGLLERLAADRPNAASVAVDSATGVDPRGKVLGGERGEEVPRAGL